MKDIKKKRLALGIEYDGSAYFGWQRQQNVQSIQACLEKALSKIADHEVLSYCAGRTDAGVHSIGQVIHFDTVAERNDMAWTLGVNSNLPSDVVVRWVKAVSEDFHARFSATARRYCYLIDNHRVRPAILSHGMTHVHFPLDAEIMHEAAQCLLGEHDFSAFRSSQCQSRTPWRKVTSLNVHRYSDYLVVDIKANAFLHHMVRNIVGSLIKIGCGEQDKDWLAELLASKDRSLAAAKAKAEGLYLVSVDYPSRFALPAPHRIGPFILETI